MDRALREFRVRGVKTNIPFLENMVNNPSFKPVTSPLRFWTSIRSYSVSRRAGTGRAPRFQHTEHRRDESVVRSSTTPTGRSAATPRRRSRGRACSRARRARRRSASRLRHDGHAARARARPAPRTALPSVAGAPSSAVRVVPRRERARSSRRQQRQPRHARRPGSPPPPRARRAGGRACARTVAGREEVRAARAA